MPTSHDHDSGADTMTTSAWVGEERLAARGGVRVVAPFHDRNEAIAAILTDLEAQGFGHWALTYADVENATATTSAMSITVPDAPMHVTLCCDRAPDTTLSDRDLESVAFAGRLVATLLAADMNLDGLLHRAVRAEQESMTDGLTALPNGRSWWRSLAREASRCDRHELTAIIAVVDLDDLKFVNDSRGHLAGDVLLRTVAEALTNTMRVCDVVARVGGDEFGVLAVDYQPPERLVKRLRHSLADVGASASIGVALYQPGGFIDETFDEADRNMYKAKRAARASRQHLISVSGRTPASRR